MKIKTYLLSLSLLVCLISANAQDYNKVFFNLAQQPNINNVTSFGASDDYISILVSYSVTGTKYAYLRVFDGTSWFSTDTFIYNGTLNRVLTYKNKFYVFGQFSAIDGKGAPSGKCISLVGLKNNAWDSLNSSLLPDTVKLKSAVGNDEGIYMISESSKKLSEIFMVNPSTGAQTSYKVACNLPSYGFIAMSANANRFVAYATAGTMSSVNGSGVGQLFLISQGNVSTPSGLNSGSMLSAAVDLNGDIIYNTDIGPVMNKWNGSSSKSIAFNLGTKVFGAIPVICTDEAWFLPGVLNGSTNTMYALDKNGSNWFNINFHKTSEWLTFSKNLGTFNLDRNTFLVSRLEKAAYIQGTLFHDKDSNCSKGGGENGIAFQYVSYKDNTLKYETISDENGHYNLAVPQGKYVLDKLPAHLHTGNCSFPNDSIHKEETDTIDIPARALRAREIDVVLVPGSRRWGEHSVQSIFIRNLGNDSRTLDLKFRLPDNSSYVSSTPSGTVSGKDLQWSVSLAGLEVKRYTVDLLLDTGKSKPGDSLYLHAWAENYGSDDDTSNNRARIVQSIRAAYDPNYKQSFPEGDVKAFKTPVLYTIHFQNLGNDFARHVIVRDTLSAILKIESIEIVGSSHPVRAELKDGILTFSFSNILLDYSSHSIEASKGWVAFRIKTQGGLAVNTVIPNRAGIYFDFNPVVITNTALIRITELNSSLRNVASTSNLKVYPNPASDVLTVESVQTATGNISIYNLQGQLVMQQPADSDKTTIIDIAQLNPGIYILVIGNESVKFVIE